ncbi:MAG: nucleoside transporter C-terminal domain-containing protein [Bacteroidales bacterium]
MHQRITFKIFIAIAFLAFPFFLQGQVTPAEHAAANVAGNGVNMQNILRGLLGIAVLIGLGYLLSSNRRAIRWRTILIGLAIQVVIALAVLKVPVVMYFFEFVGKMFIKVLDSSNAGSDFLFKSFVSNEMEIGLINFAFRILPTIIFFSALTSVLFYYGIIQKVVYGLAWLLTKALYVSGAESLSAASNIFLGQTESPLLIKEYLEKMNRSEIMLVMVGGMATIAGGVLAVYIGLLGGDDPQGKLLFAKHLITASVMAAPGAIVMAKLLVPQTDPIISEIRITREKVGSNILDAIANGTGQGIRLAVNVAAMLIVFIAFVYLVNFILMKVGDWTNLNQAIAALSAGQYEHISLQFMLGYALAPLTWLLGVSGPDITLVGQLFGEKIILNEMIAYISLKDLLAAGVFTEQKSIIMVTYMLCGFANVGSVGILLGGIGALAPGQKLNLSRLGFKALLGGGMASLLSATIIGMLFS